MTTYFITLTIKKKPKPTLRIDMAATICQTNLYTIARSGTSLFSAILVNNKVVLDRVEELQRLGSNYSEGKPHKGRTTKPIDQVHVLTLIPVGQYCCIVIVESFSKIPVAYTCLLSASDTAVCNPSTLPASH